ncbi:MAG: aminotransferase class IV, partial [Psychrobium sp.]
MTSTWVNGVATDQVRVTDRGFSYGDGIFTTIKVTNARCELLTEHLVRLQHGITTLAITQIDFKALLDEISRVAKSLINGVIKVVITRGEGQRGYSSVGCNSPTVVISTSTLPAIYKDWQKKTESLMYFFKQDCNFLSTYIDDNEKFDTLFVVKEGQHP